MQGTARVPAAAAGGIPDPLAASESRAERAPHPAGLSIAQHRRVPEPSGDTGSSAVLQPLGEHCGQERAGAAVSASWPQLSAGLASGAVLREPGR